MDRGEETMATMRPKPQVMRLSDAAAARIKELLAQSQKPIAGVRVGVKNGGCAGMAYTMEYAEEIAPTDENGGDKGVGLLIDPKTWLFLPRTHLEFKIDKSSRHVAVKNPNPVS